jgi:tRNA (guanine37-N1)-methyltransferase
MRLDVVTIFPEYLAPLQQSLLGKAIARGQVQVGVHDLRRWTDDVHRTVDDTPYGGSQPRLIVPTPTGRPFSQALAADLADEPWLLFACGRYEGIDARVAQYASARMRVDEISLGDYVLAGGEVAVLVIVEAVARLLPGVLGNSASAADDSFAAGPDGLLEAPAYTKPATWRGLDVPPVLLSGNHAEIRRWRAERSRELTEQRRPDLLD